MVPFLLRFLVVVVFGITLYEATPLPFTDDRGAVMVIHGTSLLAVQADTPVPVTFIVPEPPAAANDLLVGEIA